MYRIAIADDNELYLSNIKHNVIDILDGEIQMLLEFSSTSDFITHIEEQGVDFDIFITDIDFNNEKVNGINLAQKVNEYSSACQLIFVTSYLSFATEVYDTNHVYFMLKKDMKSKLPIAIEKAIGNIEKYRDSMITVFQKGQNIVINQNDILYLERIQRVTQIRLTNDMISCYETIEELLERMNNSIFVQCHKSYAVNLTKITSHRKNVIILCKNTLIPVSRSRQKNVNAIFMRYVGNLYDNHYE